jgi:hypothetical protein
VRARLTRRTSGDDTRDAFDAYERALRSKYLQYQDAEFVELIVFDAVSLIGWSAAEADDASSVS